MILHAEDGMLGVPQAFQRAIVEIDVRRFHVARQGRRIYGEAVVLRGDFDALALPVQHRLVGAAVAELELESLGPQRQAQKLMSKADAEDRSFADELTNGLLSVAERLRVAWTIGQEHAVRVGREDLLGGSRARHHRDIAADLRQTAQDVPLHAEIESDDAMPFASRLQLLGSKRGDKSFTP